MSLSKFLFSLIFVSSFGSQAAERLGKGMVTSVNGTAEVLTASNDKSESQPKVLFEGKKYLLAKAKVGMRVL